MCPRRERPPAEHVPLRPGHTPRSWAAALFFCPTYYIGDVSLGSRTRSRRGSSVSATIAPPRSTRLRVVVPQCHIMGLPYPPCAFSRAHSTYPMARWGVETNTPYLSILIAGRRLAGESVYSAHDLARTLRGQVCLRRALAARSLRLRGLAIFRGLGPPID